MRMEVLFGIHEVWDAVDMGLADAKKNNSVKGSLFQSVLKDLVLQIGNLETGKEMGEAKKTRNLWVNRLDDSKRMKKVSKKEKADDSQEKLLYARTDYSNRNSDSSRGRGRDQKRDYEANLSETHKGDVNHEEGTFFMMNHIQETIFMNEEKYAPPKSESNTDEDDVWYFDSDASNHMSGCDIHIRVDFLTMRDSCGSLLLKVPRSANRLYKTQLKVGKPYCLQDNIYEESWLWHVRLGHVGFGAVNLMHKLAKGVPEGWKIYHLDVKKDFLHGELKEDVYVIQPKGFEKPGEERKVYKLAK
ncbi:uncharacterized mitochondrial protein-like protein [Tanacetum coccineum]